MEKAGTAGDRIKEQKFESQTAEWEWVIGRNANGYNLLTEWFTNGFIITAEYSCLWSSQQENEFLS